jgi:hypothetical protein
MFTGDGDTLASAHSPQGAWRVQGHIQGLKDLLLRHPYRPPHEWSDDPPDDDDAVPRLVFCEVTDSEIIIQAIRHARFRLINVLCHLANVTATRSARPCWSVVLLRPACR